MARGLGLDETAHGIAVSVNGDAASYLHDEAAEVTVVSLEVSSYERAHPLEVSSGKPFVYKHAVSKALVVTRNDIRVVLGEVISADALEVGQDSREEKEADLGEVSAYSSRRRILLVKVLMMICRFISFFLVFRHVISSVTVLIQPKLIYIITIIISKSNYIDLK